MANVAHASLTGTELHEPKGVAAAAAGTVYVANGAGSGSWAAVGTSNFTGMIADFPALEAPPGWLELDGTTISTVTYANLFAVMSKTTSGTRSNGLPTITSIPDTSKFKAGYYVFGTGLAAGLTILSVDSPTQITLSGNAGSSGTSSFFVSPWLIDTGAIKLPDVTGVGRYRRSRSSTTKVGDVQTDQNKAHTHAITGTTGSDGAHIHTINDPQHAHTERASPAGGAGGIIISNVSNSYIDIIGNPTALASTGITINSNGTHSHAVSGTAVSDGAAEARPTTMVFITCVKT